MDKFDARCPREDPTRDRYPEVLPCPKCGGEVEIWHDEKAGRCSGCKARIPREELEKKP